MKWPKAKKSFAIPLYGGTVYLFKDQARYAKACEFLGAKASGKVLAGTCWHMVNDKTGESIYLVGWYDGKLSTLVHELTHAAVLCFNYTGIDPADSGGEALAYLLTELFERCTAE